MHLLDKPLLWLSKADTFGFGLMRIVIAIDFLWIGGLKFLSYETDSITPFVANNPGLSQFYRHPDQYRAHLTRDGELVPEHRAWQRVNNTFAFSTGLGMVEIAIGLLVLSSSGSVPLGAIGAVLAFLTSVVTLFFLITTPEAWVPALGDAAPRVPLPVGRGAAGVDGLMLLAGGFRLMVESARALRSAERRQHADLRPLIAEPFDQVPSASRVAPLRLAHMAPNPSS